MIFYILLNNKNFQLVKLCLEKNDYLNGACYDIIKSNKNESELREFCSKAPAWSDTTGPNASYTDICGCYYPDKYYSNLKKIISDKTKIPEDMLGDKRCYSSLCSISEMTDTYCPDLNILTCLINCSLILIRNIIQYLLLLIKGKIILNQ